MSLLLKLLTIDGLDRKYNRVTEKINGIKPVSAYQPLDAKSSEKMKKLKALRDEIVAEKHLRRRRLFAGHDGR